MAENPVWYARKCLISWIILCLNFYTDFNTFLVISWQSITYTVIPNFSASDQLLIPHDFWISSERQKTIRLNVWDQSINHSEIMPHPRIEPANPVLHIQFSIYWAHLAGISWITVSSFFLHLTSTELPVQLLCSFFYLIVLRSLFSNMKLKWIIIIAL